MRPTSSHTGARCPSRTVEELQRRTGLPEAALERLADADAYLDLHLDRRSGALGGARLGRHHAAAVRAGGRRRSAATGGGRGRPSH